MIEKRVTDLSTKSTIHLERTVRAKPVSTQTISHTVTNYRCSPKKHFLTPTERKFFYLASHCIPSDCMLVIKPRLVDLVYLDEHAPNFYSLLAMHLDFVVMRYPQMVAVLAIELDDPSHDTREHTDELKNNILKESNIPLLRLKTSAYYPASELKHIIHTAIKNSTDHTYSLYNREE